MNKKTYIVEENQIRLKPDVEKPQGNYGLEYLHNRDAYEEALAASPTYQKSGDWSAYKIGDEISEDEVEIHTEWSNETLMIMAGNGDNPKDFPYEPIAIPKKKEASATGQGMGEAEAIANKVFPNGTAGDTHFDYLQGVRREAFIEGLVYKGSTPQGSGQGMKWVKVEDFNIEKRIRYNVWDGLIITDAFLDSDEVWKETQTEKPLQWPISHIMPLPEPPQQKEDTP